MTDPQGLAGPVRGRRSDRRRNGPVADSERGWRRGRTGAQWEPELGPWASEKGQPRLDDRQRGRSDGVWLSLHNDRCEQTPLQDWSQGHRGDEEKPARAEGSWPH